MQHNMQDQQQNLVRVSEHQFRIGEQVIPLYSGAVHYWRLDRAKWEDILDKVKDAGFTAITTYIPWEVHETRRGEFDFGEENPSNDIDAFLTLCEKKGLKVIVRPGPQINSELTWFGYPKRILEDPELQARTAQGTKAILTQVPRPIPALSYAAEKFFTETAHWYDAICPILAKHKYPQGCIIAAQVDNEMAYFFHVNPYTCDYSPASIDKYHAFLQNKYRTIEKLNSTYRKQYKTFEQVDPPRRFEGERKEDIPYYTDWIEYREYYLVDSLAKLAEMMKARGLQGIPLFHNYPHPLGPGGSASGITTPFNLPALEEKLDFVGFDIYSRKELYNHVKTVVSYVVGVSRYPFIPEFIAGVWPWYLHPGDLEDEEFVTKAALMHGIKGFSRYMIVERNRWLASPIRRDGRIRKEQYAFFHRVNELLKRHRFVDLRRQSDILLLANREYDRLEAASVLISFPGDFLEPLLGFSEYPNFMSISENSLGFTEPIQLAKTDWFSALYNGLTELGYSFLLGDSALPVKTFQRYKVIMLSSFEYMSELLQQNLVTFAKEGGLVVLGPQIPAFNDQIFEANILANVIESAPQHRSLTIEGEKIAELYNIGAGHIVHVLTLTENPVHVIRTILNEYDLARVRKGDTRLDVTIHRDLKQPNRIVVFVANPSSENVRAEVALEIEGLRLQSVKDIWDERLIDATDRAWTDQLLPYSIKLYECIFKIEEGGKHAA